MGDVPLAARMRPRSFEEFVGQGAPRRRGAGAHARALARLAALDHPVGTRGHRARRPWRTCSPTRSGAELMQLSAVNSGVADARKVMDGARGGLFRTVLFVDEVHRWSKAQQDVLLPAVEEGTVTLIGATTENPYFSLNTPLLSRCLLLRLEPLDDEAVATLLRRALDDADRGLGRAGLTIADDALQHLVSVAGGDARMALTGLEAAADAARAAGATRDHARRRGRRGAEEGHRLRPPGRRALRRDQRVHQVDPRLGPRRRAVLARPHDRGGGGPAVHRQAADRARERGHRHGRLAGAARRGRGRAGGRARGPARGAAEPGPRDDLPGDRARSRTACTRRSARRSRTRRRPNPCRCTCATRATRAPSSWATAKGTGTRTTSPGHAVEQEYRPPTLSDRRYYEPSGQGDDVAREPGTGRPLDDDRAVSAGCRRRRRVG